MTDTDTPEPRDPLAGYRAAVALADDGVAWRYAYPPTDRPTNKGDDE